MLTYIPRQKQLSSSFYQFSSQSDFLIGNSPIKTGEVVGTAIINVAIPPVTVSLKNESTDTVYYPPNVPRTATLVIIEDDNNVDNQENLKKPEEILNKLVQSHINPTNFVL